MRVTLTVDGLLHEVDVAPDRRLIEILRDDLDIMGPKQPCGIGRCGACLVIMDDRPVNACLVTAARVDGAQIVTAAGLGSQADSVRDAIAKSGAIQCGYCASGWITLLTWMTSRPIIASKEECETMLAGQICRCTGYGGFRRALELLRAKAPPSGTTNSH